MSLLCNYLSCREDELQTSTAFSKTKAIASLLRDSKKLILYSSPDFHTG